MKKNVMGLTLGIFIFSSLLAFEKKKNIMQDEQVISVRIGGVPKLHISTTYAAPLIRELKRFSEMMAPVKDRVVTYEVWAEKKLIYQDYFNPDQVRIVLSVLPTTQRIISKKKLGHVITQEQAKKIEEDTLRKPRVSARSKNKSKEHSKIQGHDKNSSRIKRI